MFCQCARIEKVTYKLFLNNASQKKQGVMNSCCLVKGHGSHMLRENHAYKWSFIFYPYSEKVDKIMENASRYIRTTVDPHFPITFEKLEHEIFFRCNDILIDTSVVHLHPLLDH